MKEEQISHGLSDVCFRVLSRFLLLIYKWFMSMNTVILHAIIASLNVHENSVYEVEILSFCHLSVLFV